MPFATESQKASDSMSTLEEVIKNELDLIDNTNCQDEIAINTVLKYFFYAKAKNYEGKNDFDFSIFFTANKDNTDFQYYSDKQKYKKIVYQKEENSLLFFDTDIEIQELKIEESKAHVIVNEEYDYLYNNNNGLFSSMGDTYEIELVNEDKNKWRITKIFSADELIRITIRLALIFKAYSIAYI